MNVDTIRSRLVNCVTFRDGRLALKIISTSIHAGRIKRFNIKLFK